MTPATRRTVPAGPLPGDMDAVFQVAARTGQPVIGPPMGDEEAADRRHARRLTPAPRCGVARPAGPLGARPSRSGGPTEILTRARLPRGRGWGADWLMAVAPMLREVRAMGLTWRDLASSVAVLAMVLAYSALEFRAGLLLVSSAWSASAVELVLGSVCAVTAAMDLHTTPQPRAGRIVRRITTVLGAIALLAGLAGLAGNNAHAVEVVVVATVFLWLTATLWHVLSIGSEA